MERAPSVQAMVYHSIAYRDYVNYGRVHKAFKELGRIKHRKQMHNYVRHIKKDIIKDFFKDYPALKDGLSEEEQAYVFDFNQALKLMLLSFVQ